MNTIGKNVKKFREQAGLTQEKLADKVNLSLRYIQCIEAGTRIPKTMTLLKIASVLGITLNDIVY